MAVIVKAACLKLGSLVATSHSKRLVTISMKLGSIDESMTITVSVPCVERQSNGEDLRAQGGLRHLRLVAAVELLSEGRSLAAGHGQRGEVSLTGRAPVKVRVRSAPGRLSLLAAGLLRIPAIHR
jgi:hypothetical protein